jgi:hypothetical protein
LRATEMSGGDDPFIDPHSVHQLADGEGKVENEQGEDLVVARELQELPSPSRDGLIVVGWGVQFVVGGVQLNKNTFDQSSFWAGREQHALTTTKPRRVETARRLTEAA